MAQSFKTQVAEARNAVSPVTPQEAAALRSRDDVVFVDPRPAEAIASTTGIIPGARNVVLADISAGKLPTDLADRTLRVVTACQAGPMGAVAAHEFLKLGFSHVNYLEGGTEGWLGAGLPTDR